jgi:hypothetical protein
MRIIHTNMLNCGISLSLGSIKGGRSDIKKAHALGLPTAIQNPCPAKQRPEA